MMIQAYSEPCAVLAYIQKPGILWTLECLETFHNCILTHIQSPVIFTKIYEYLKLWHIQNSTHIQKPLKDLRWSFSQKRKNGKKHNFFFKALHLRSLARLWKFISLNKYSLTCGVTSRYKLYDAYTESCLLSKIQTYSTIFTSSSDIFSHIVYLEPSVTLAYSKPYHIQNPSIFRTQDICICMYIYIYIQNSVIAYFGIFRMLCNARILRTLLYSELGHIQNFGIIWTQGIFRILFI